MCVSRQRSMCKVQRSTVLLAWSCVRSRINAQHTGLGTRAFTAPSRGSDGGQRRGVACVCGVLIHACALDYDAEDAQSRVLLRTECSAGVLHNQVVSGCQHDVRRTWSRLLALDALSYMCCIGHHTGDSSFLRRSLQQQRLCQALCATSTVTRSAASRHPMLKPLVLLPAVLAGVVVCVLPCIQNRSHHSSKASVSKQCIVPSCRLALLLFGVVFMMLCQAHVRDMNTC